MIQDAPHGASIVCGSSTQAAYARALAKKYGRLDIKITNKLKPEGGA